MLSRLIFLPIILSHSQPTWLFRRPTVDSSCQTPAGENGKCIRITDCVPVNRSRYITEDKITTNFLRESACGFDMNTPKICCREDEIRPVFEVRKEIKETTEIEATTTNEIYQSIEERKREIALFWKLKYD
eukprot:GFUD01056801.1.p1 GENE.GFUD01056801.1~~GFUD01056801.1.p1  ORF type:complete len:131 (+),score=21.85 GFUD01056801.1:21-413(+)